MLVLFTLAFPLLVDRPGHGEKRHRPVLSVYNDDLRAFVIPRQAANAHGVRSAIRMDRLLELESLSERVACPPRIVFLPRREVRLVRKILERFWAVEGQ